MIPENFLQLLPQGVATCVFNPIIPHKKAHYTLLAIDCLVATLITGTLLAASVKILVGAAVTLSVILIGSLAKGILFRYLAEKHYKLVLEAKEEQLRFDHFKKAADLGHMEAQFKVGELYNAFDYYKKAADQGHPQALFNVACAYEKKKEYQSAFQYYLQAEARGVIESYARIGNFYVRGDGVEKNYEKAIEYYRIGAIKNDPIAKMNLAHLYIEGPSAYQNIEKGIKYYKKIMGINAHPVAAYNLAKYYERGEIITQDLDKAINYYFKAAELEDEKAIEFLKSLAKTDYRYGMANFRLGIMYQEKKTVLDVIEAIYCYKKLIDGYEMENATKRLVCCYTYLKEEANEGDEIATNFLRENQIESQI